jgi:hypothetical protein
MEGTVRFNDPVDTLAYHTQGRPLTNAVDISGLKVADFAKAGRDFLSKYGKVAPESDALFFYAGNHALAALRAKYSMHEPLDPKDLDLVRRYYQYGNLAFQRMLFYCLVICFREARHLHNKTAFKKKFEDAGFTSSVANFVTSVNDDAHQAMEQLINSKSQVTVGDAARALSFAFHKGGWGHAFGGKKWGVIADAVVDVVHGKVTPEVFTDIGFALAHNGGPIFNKQMFYNTWTKDLLKILDVQRAGEVPHFINAMSSPFINGDHQAFVVSMHHLGEEFSTSVVDVDKVAQFGISGYFKKAAAPVVPPPAIKGFVKHVTYWPGKTVTKITREGLTP